MLPTPISFASRRPYRRNGGSSDFRRTLDTLLTRARVTNLAVLLLATFAGLSFIVNVSYYFSRTKAAYSDGISQSSIMATISRSKALRDIDHLVMVPGHAIWQGMDAESRRNEDEWVLEPYQKKSGRVETFFQHISRGAEIARTDRHALVIFSGGQTRASSTMTEAESYLRLALNANLFDDDDTATPFLRATTENYALDSFQNLLFSVARFHEFVGHFPAKITVVGYEMKRKRFAELHRAAIRWPEESFDYIGVDPPEETNLAQQGELLNAYLPFKTDLYGCHSSLMAKRRSRNPFSRFHSYFTSTPELAGILNYCPADSSTLYQGVLPWT